MKGAGQRAFRPRLRFRGILARLALALVVPTVLFGSLELALRVFGYGHSPDFFIPDESPGIYRTNPRFTEQFFPASFGLKPLNFRLPKEKPPGALRVFVIGESAAMGVPEPGFAVAPQLRAQLRAAHPARTIEVYNLGITAINSHAIVPIVEQAAAFSPDLFVVYMGNNEVVGPFGPSSVVTGSTPPLALIRASLWVRGTRIGQLVQNALAGLRSSGASYRDWRGMEMFAGKTVAADDPRLQQVYKNFAANLSAIVRTARNARVPVVLSTVAVNVLECAPFASLHAAGLSPTQRTDFDRAVADGDFAQAVALDPQYAETQFQFADALLARGDFVAARSHYLAALHWDALRFRADATINQLIREQARRTPMVTTLVDAALALGSDAASTVPPAGGELFLEHVHLTWDGNFELARLLADGVARALPQPAAAGLDRAACAAATGFTPFGRATIAMSMTQLTGRPPFTNQLSFARDRSRLQAEIAEAQAIVARPGALSQMAAAIAAAQRNDPDNPFLLFHEASIRAELGELARALELNEQLAALQPPSPELAAQRGYLLQELHRTADAETVLVESAERDPFYFQTYGLLLRLWSSTGEPRKAAAYFAERVDRMPDSLALRHAYAGSLAGAGDLAGAEEQWRAILRSTPDDEGALRSLTTRLGASGHAEVLQLRQAAHAYNPRSLENNRMLLQFFLPEFEEELTKQYLRDLAASGPVGAEWYLTLGAKLRDLGRPQEAAEPVQRALEIAASAEDEATLQQARTLLDEIRGGTP